jgi:acetyltransferase-like isoleucine patch superfamily enzyme
MFSFVKKFFKGIEKEHYSSLQVIKKSFWEINWIKTIWFNFMALPFKQAIKIPFIIGYNVKIQSIGKIILHKKCYTGMISLGVMKIPMWESNSVQLMFTNHGTVFFSGRAKFHPGVKLSISQNALLILGERNSIGYNSRIVVQHTISIGDDFRISWDGQIFDTDFHFLRKIESDRIYTRKKPVIIGDNVWAGNRVSIGKGTIIPNGSVISCCTKVSGDLSNEGENLLIVGNPGKVVSKGYLMGNSWFPQEENRIAKERKEDDLIKEYNDNLINNIMHG